MDGHSMIKVKCFKECVADVIMATHFQVPIPTTMTTPVTLTAPHNDNDSQYHHLHNNDDGLTQQLDDSSESSLSARKNLPTQQTDQANSSLLGEMPN